MIRVVQHLLIKSEALSSNSSTEKSFQIQPDPLPSAAKEENDQKCQTAGTPEAAKSPWGHLVTTRLSHKGLEGSLNQVQKD
jgi:hypothetical protein